MSIEMWLYLEIDLICIFIMVLLSYNLRKKIGSLLDDRLFRFVTISTSVLLVADAAYAVFTAKSDILSIFMNYFANSVFLFMMGFTSALWFLFTDYKLNPTSSTITRDLKFFSAPLVLSFLLILSNPWTKVVFYLDGNNNYQHGSYHIIQMIISYFYMFFAAFKALYHAVRASDIKKRNEAFTLASFLILPLIGGIAQAINYHLPLTWAGATLSFLIVFINIQNQQISKDALTGINNRRQLNKYLDAKLEDNIKGGTLYMILLDIDYFKSINDTYGHVEGDAALIKLANILMQACSTTKDFLARYGGDEFAIICIRHEESEVLEIMDVIHQLVAQSNQTADTPYALSVSMGYASFDPESMETQDKLINAADSELYKVKAMHHAFEQ